ncbi:hypothetical protein BSL78_04933 [Apostichopus japonicus]|uniref:HYR domain-containing protein n=1 Tax=Stichopus japonicus TaxID=307972 RepID=A0A2G8LCZ9_STIJA|nr:hypothetical protein BSL78_04933 [Apostichopus japonicus]
MRSSEVWQGAPRQGYPNGSPGPIGGIGNGAIFGCACVCVIVVVAVIAGVALGLVFGLSPSNNTAGNDANVPVIPGVPAAPTQPPNNPSITSNDIVAIDTTLDTTIPFNSDFNDPSSTAFEILGTLVLPPIGSSFMSSNLASVYQGSELISATDVNGNTRVVVRSRFLARPPLVVTDQNAALSSGTILANSVLETDAEDGRIQNNLNVVLGSVQSTAVGINIAEGNPGNGGPTGTANSLSIACPGDVVAVVQNEGDSVAVTWDPPVISNADGAVSISYSPAPNSLFDFGRTVVVVTVADASTAVQCNFDVNVQVGTSSFVIICPNDITVGTQPGETFARVNFNAPQVIGQTNGRVTFTYDPPQTTTFPIGSSTVVVTVETNVRHDVHICCHSQSSLRCVLGQDALTHLPLSNQGLNGYLRDEELPIVTCDAGGVRDTDVGQDYATIMWTTPTATDNMDNTLTVTVSRSEGRFPIGTHTIIATATDSSGNIGTCSWTYTVRDVELPVVTCPPLLNVRLPSTHTTVVVEYENLITATDNVGTGVIINVHPSDLRPFAAGTYNPVATATDSSGNSNSCTFTLTVSDNCGKSGQTLTPRIIGGEDAGAGQFPWIASLSSGSHFCGSAIINENWVVTAAHCPDLLGVDVITGDVSLLTASSQRRTRRVTKVIQHSSYLAPPAHDIALLKLDSPLIMTDFIQPACLTTEEEEEDLFGSGECRVAGWGTLIADATAPPSDTLKVVTVNVYTEQECEDIYNANVPLGTRITSINICAGLLEGGRDACFGDSGGGLVCPDSSNTWHVVGLVSSGRGCAEANAPGIYTRTSQFNDFIYAYLGAELVVVEPNNMASFSSPLEGNQYPNNVVKGWRFRRFGGTGIRLEFAQFDVAAGDTLTVGQGLDPSDETSILRVMESDFSSVVLEYPGHTNLWFRFISNRSRTAQGFLIRVYVII